jgi:hypothetical protein
MHKAMVQVKFTIEAEIVSAFKARCEAEGVSMTSVIRQWMTAEKPAKDRKARIDSRPLRRATVRESISLLEMVLQAEEAYRDAIPEVFQARRDTADWACGELEMAIDILQNAF